MKNLLLTNLIIAIVTDFVICYREWCKVSPMAISRILPGVASLNGCIYVVGGEQESKILANGEFYDPLDDKWCDISSMVIPR